VAVFNELSTEDLVSILTKPKNAIIRSSRSSSRWKAWRSSSTRRRS